MKEIYLVSMVKVSIPDNASERLEKVLAYMSQHCADATLVSVAAHFNFHPNTVSGMIKRETGKSFGDTLREIRMQRALGLLETRTLSIAQIAQLCGYENPSNFYRVFKDSFGMTPRAYMARRDAGEEVFTGDAAPVAARYVEVDEGVAAGTMREGAALDEVLDEVDARLEGKLVALGEELSDEEYAAQFEEATEPEEPMPAPVRVPADELRGAVTVTSGSGDSSMGAAGSRLR